MRRKGDKSRERFLDHAWRIAFDSMIFDVKGTAEHGSELHIQARHYIRNIDKSDWWPIASKLYDEGDNYDDHGLAERASSIFINRKMATSGLKVTAGGDY